MSTRCNVIIKDANESVQLYHHHDGYPSGVGKDLKEYLHEMGDNVEHTADAIANYLCGQDDDEYVRENSSIGLHGDIEYLYIIDLEEDTITCRSVWFGFDGKITDEEVISGTYEDEYNYTEYVEDIEW